MIMYMILLIWCSTAERPMALWEQWQHWSSVDWFAAFLVRRLQRKRVSRLHQTEGTADTHW